MADRTAMGETAHPHPAPPAWVADVIAGALIVGAAFAPFPSEEFRPSGAFALATVLAPAALLPLRRRWPISVLAAIIGLYGVAAFTGTLAPGIVVAATFAMFAVATRSSRRTTLFVMASAVAAVVMLSLLAAIGSVFDPRAVQFAVTVALAAAVGDAERSRREYVRAIMERAERAELARDSEAMRRVTEERLRIARDLHDAVAHQISVISLNAGVVSSSLETRPEKAREALGTIRSAARTVLGEIGDLLDVLRRDGGDPPTTAPQRGLGQLDTLVDQFAEVGLSVLVRIEGDTSALTGAADLVAYRVVQEALTNAHKHGAEGRAHVLIALDDERASIVVTNPIADQSTLPAPSDSAPGGYGLVGLRERVASVRGSVTTGPCPGGYRVEAELPLSREDDR